MKEKNKIVCFENVGMRYGISQEILLDISFTLEKGSFTFITGSSGAGKSTLLKLLYLAHLPSRGKIRLFGKDVTKINRSELPGIRQRIGVVFQNFRLIPSLTTLDNVALPLRIAGASEVQVKEHVPELLDWVGLGKHLHDYPETLSGGQKQRVAIARAVIARPSLLLADEPTGNVDDQIALKFMFLLKELNKIGTTIIVATHDETLISRFDLPRLHLESGHLNFPEGSVTNGAIR